MSKPSRVQFLDNLRGITILFVVMFHASLTCMKQSPIWWYVHNENVSVIHSIIVVLFDTFMMPVLFLISGTVQGINRGNETEALALAKKARRLLLPWILGVLLIGPYLSIKVASNLGNEISWFRMITHDFWTNYFTHGPYWFLSLLFSFNLLVLVIPKRFFDQFRERLMNRLTMVILLTSISVCGYLGGSFIWGSDKWMDVAYLWAFQPSRLFTYFAFFIVGLAMSGKTENLSLTSWQWNVVCIVASILLLGIKGNPEASLFLNALAYGIVAVALSLRIFGWAKVSLDKKIVALDWLGKHSFTLYIIHLPIQVYIGTMLVEFKLSAWTMWVALIASSLVFTWFWGIGITGLERHR